jgi:SecD/SecF fusion protein
MNRNNTWRLAFVVFAVVWAVIEVYPWWNRDLLEVFRERAVRQDAAFSSIVAQAGAMQKTNEVRAYGNLRDAIGTNDITVYFPFYSVSNEVRPTDAILNKLQREARGSIKLGLDLQGGTSFLVEMDTNRLAAAVGDTNAAAPAQELEVVLAQAVEVLRKRVDRFGVAEPVIQPAGNNRILIQLPGLSEADKESAKSQIQKAAYLEFRMVHPQSDELLAQGMTEPGYEILKEKDRGADGREVLRPILVKKRAERGLNGSYVRRAIVTRGNLGEPEIDFELNSEGAGIFAEVTRENIGRRLAIVLDGELYSAPVIRGEIPGGRGQITGRFDQKEAFELANVLENPLRAPLRIIESREVDPTLGKDSIQSGVKAAIRGVIAVAAFMLVYYLLSGIVANVALMLNIIILLGVMSYVGTTLTLPGIAGIVLTIGMAVDANVLIFERIREELAAGKSMRGALEAGYDKAWGTIIDSNLTTLISSVILIFMGTGPVKGFGVTLTIGITVSMFTALIVTRLIFDFLVARNWLKSLKMLHLVPTGLRLDFMKLALPAFIISWTLIVIGNGYGISRGKDVFSVEFVGGYSISLNFDQQAKAGKVIEVDKLRDVVDKLGKGASQVSFQRDISTGKETLRINIRDVGEEKAGEDYAALVVKTLKQTFPTAGFEKPSVDRIGPTVGAEIQRVAVIASLLAMFGILVYVAFRYEFSFAVGAVIAIIHDILMTLGWYFLAGREVNATTVAALLTIIGFSINDTIVIFDRIREDLKLGVRGSFREIMNAALNQTMSRTIITSGTVFIATLSLYLFGGGVINDFAFCFLVGILTGTYSSIYIAGFIVLKWHKGQRPKIGATQLTVDNPMTAKT